MSLSKCCVALAEIPPATARCSRKKASISCWYRFTSILTVAVSLKCDRCTISWVRVRLMTQKYQNWELTLNEILGKKAASVSIFGLFLTTEDMESPSLNESSVFGKPSPGLWKWEINMYSLRCFVNLGPSPPANSAINRNVFGILCTEVRVYIRFVRKSSRACIWTCFGASSKFLAIITFAMVLFSPKDSDGGDLVIDWNPGVLRKYESCRGRIGEVDLAGLTSTDRMACAKSSSEVCSEQSITAWDKPNTLAAT